MSFSQEELKKIIRKELDSKFDEKFQKFIEDSQPPRFQRGQGKGMSQGMRGYGRGGQCIGMGMRGQGMGYGMRRQGMGEQCIGLGMRQQGMGMGRRGNWMGPMAWFCKRRICF